MTQFVIQAWTLTSVDDGDTWSGPKVSPPQDAATRNIQVTGVSQHNSRAVRAAENSTLVVVNDTLTDGVRVGFYVLDQGTDPVANGERNGIIFKRGENHGTAAWL